MIKESIEVAISFDTTGSMYPCLSQVRQRVQETVRRLFNDIPYLRVAIIAHGDYCDGPRVISKLDFSENIGEICKFVSTVQATDGGDAPECYELVLNEARGLSWSAGKNKALVLIGDDVPHDQNYYLNKKRLDWRNELGLLREAGVHVHAMQALGKSYATSFYAELASRSGGRHLQLHQFADVVELITAICYRQSSPAQFERYTHEVQTSGRMSRSLYQAFAELIGKGAEAERQAEALYGKTDLDAVHPSRFQVLEVPKDCEISQFVENNGLRFKLGRGFYEFSKSVKVQDHKEVILVDRRSGDMFSGAAARRLLGLPTEGTVTINPKKLATVVERYRPFIQSTSTNRKLIGGTRFLYEMED